MELQREIAILEDQVRALQKSLEEKLADLSQQAREATDASRSTNTSIAGLEQKLGEQSKTLAAPVATIGAKVDEMSGEFQSVRESVASLNARMARLEQQLVDISTAIKTLQAPPAPPEAVAATETGISAETLFQNALRDRDRGNLALALKGFTEYLQVFGSTEQAASAQYYIGDVYYRNEQFDDAVKSFDLVLTNYLDSDRAADAHYMKGMALLKLKETAMARSEFNTLIKRFPNHELAAKARQQLKTLPAAAKPRAAKAK